MVVGKEEGPVAAAERLRLGGVEHRGSGTSELRLIAAVNESIKQAVEASWSINLVALNAAVMAGRTGARAAGFGVVARELRGFSDRMGGEVHGWTGLIYALTRETALSRREARHLHKLQEAGRLNPKAHAALAAARGRCRSKLDVLTRGNSERVAELQKLVQRVGRQSMTGEVIVRAAMIEAVYGGEMQQALQQIARGIGASIREFVAHTVNVGVLIAEVAA